MARRASLPASTRWAARTPTNLIAAAQADQRCRTAKETDLQSGALLEQTVGLSLGQSANAASVNLLSIGSAHARRASAPGSGTEANQQCQIM